MGSIEGHDLCYPFTVTINPYRITINHIFLLVLINKITKVAIRKKIYIDQAIIRNIILLYLTHLFHIVIINAYIAFSMGIFINEEIAGYFTDNFEVHSSCIIVSRLGIHYSLTQGRY